MVLCGKQDGNLKRNEVIVMELDCLEDGWAGRDPSDDTPWNPPVDESENDPEPEPEPEPLDDNEETK
jgi:hypothetical protein